MKGFHEYSLAELGDLEITLINETQSVISRNFGEEIVLLAYKKNSHTDENDR